MRNRFIVVGLHLLVVVAALGWFLSRASTHGDSTPSAHTADASALPDLPPAGDPRAAGDERGAANAPDASDLGAGTRALSITGRALGRDGQPVKGTSVAASPALMAGPEQVAATAAVAENGSFALEGLEPGVYVLLASSRTAFARSEPVSARAGDTDVRIVLEASGKVRGRVVDESGAPIPVFKVDYQEVHDPGGAFEVLLRHGGEGLVVFEADGFATTRRKVEAQGSADVELGQVVLGQGRAVGGKVLDARTRAAIPGAVVSVGTPKASGQPAGLESDTVSTRNDGSFVLPRVEPAALTLVVRHESYRPAEQPLGPDKNSVVILLEPGAVVTGTLSDADGKPYRATVDAVGERTQLHEVAEKGVYRFAAVPPGRLTVAVTTRSTERFEPQSVDVPESGEVRLDFRAAAGGSTLVVTVPKNLFPLLLEGDHPVPSSATEFQALAARAIAPARGEAGGSFVHLTPGAYTLLLLDRGEGAHALRIARQGVVVGAGPVQHLDVPMPASFSTVQADQGGRRR
ncbi:MAG: carboxypeptidase regulatory-like domain-containing protein [Myxococcales bacterium]